MNIDPIISRRRNTLPIPYLNVFNISYRGPCIHFFVGNFSYGTYYITATDTANWHWLYAEVS